MARITFLLGLAGSGKTHRAEQIARDTGAKIFEGIASDLNPGMLSEIVQRLKDGKSCIVEEIAFCIPAKREMVIAQLGASVPDAEIEWVCFENDLESANWNVRHRKNKGDIENHIAWNKRWFNLYKYPDGAVPIPITRIVPDGPGP